MQALIGFDQKIFLFLNQFNFPWLNSSMEFISGRLVWIPFVIFMAWTLYKSLPRKQFYFTILLFIMALSLSDVIASSILKNSTQRLRPCRDELIKPLMVWFEQRCGGRFGFVSSHAANSFMLVTLWWNLLKEKKKIYLLLFLVPIFVSYSRIYLGVHYPGDILGGTFVGVSVAIFMSWAWKNSRLRS